MLPLSVFSCVMRKHVFSVKNSSAKKEDFNLIQQASSVRNKATPPPSGDDAHAYTQKYCYFKVFSTNV